MALTDEGTNTTMLVQPSGIANDGFMGGNGWWILILFILLGGWNNGFGGGFGGNDLYPWMNNSQNINSGFRDQMLNDNITSIRDGIYGINNQLCSGFAGVNATVNGAQNAITQQLYTNQIADLERSFAAQTANTAGMSGLQAQLAQCCCDNRAATADLKYTVATENCADRAALADGIRDVIAATQAQTQTILDKMCQDKIDQKNDTISQLRQELLYARGQASQDVQTATLRAGQVAEADAIYNRLATCPVPSTPVYGMTPVYSVNNCGTNCGCGA